MTEGRRRSGVGLDQHELLRILKASALGAGLGAILVFLAARRAQSATAK